jgi:hypothetical protein
MMSDEIAGVPAGDASGHHRPEETNRATVVIKWSPVEREPERPATRWCFGSCNDEHDCPRGWRVNLGRFANHPWRMSVIRTPHCGRYEGFAEHIGDVLDTGLTDLDGAKAYAARAVAGLLDRQLRHDR